MAEKRSEISELVAQISSGDQLEETHANWQKLAQAAAEVERLQQDIERMSGAPGQL
jgi:prefoldin subunit 5